MGNGFGKAFGGAASGAALGAPFGPWGAAAGGLAGGIGGLFGLFDQGEQKTYFTTQLDRFAENSQPQWQHIPLQDAFDFSNKWKADNPDFTTEQYKDWLLNQSGMKIGTKGWQPFHPSTQAPDAGGGIKQEFQDDYLNMIRDAFKQYQSGGGGFGFNIPNVSFSPAHAERAHASLIDMMDKAYQEKPPADVREDVYSRLKGGAAAAAANERRKIGDAARLSGVGPNEPWVQALMTKADRSAAKDSTQGLTDFFDAWVQAALGRRHGALTTNAQLGTGVNELNAQLGTNVSMANAQGRLNASQANAQAGYWRGMLGGESARLKQSQFGDIMRAIEWLNNPIDTRHQYEPGGGDYAAAAMDPLDQVLRAIKGWTQGSLGGGNSPTSGTISPRMPA